jgi:hypothetical protein
MHRRCARAAQHDHSQRRQSIVSYHRYQLRMGGDGSLDNGAWPSCDHPREFGQGHGRSIREYRGSFSHSAYANRTLSAVGLRRLREEFTPGPHQKVFDLLGRGKGLRSCVGRSIGVVDREDRRRRYPVQPHQSVEQNLVDLAIPQRPETAVRDQRSVVQGRVGGLLKPEPVN